MFVSRDKNVAKKTFQKPNILRRGKPKVSIARPNISNINESPAPLSLVTTNVEEANISEHLDKIIQLKKNKISAEVKQTVWKLTLANSFEDKDVTKSQETDEDANMHSNASIYTITQSKCKDKNFEQSALNIESFINTTGVEQVTPLSYDDTAEPSEKLNQAKSKWCFDLVNDSMDIIVNNYSTQPHLKDSEQKLDSVIEVPSVTKFDPQHQQQAVHLQEQVEKFDILPTQTIPFDCFSRAVKYKCDHPDCNKGFWNEERLKKHKNSHNRQTVRTPTQVTYECPVKKVPADSLDEKCPLKFQVRSDLIKHLNEDHTLEDAQHRCGVCGRRFFWASGMRAHRASDCARGGLQCGWPGCGRVFRLPCRLREHARAHTGDRPYLCTYPDCGWAFRSASKLVRHSRRHTDERRHVCAACGRGFLRREHLRDHAARHHARAPRTPHACAHQGCEQTFTNMSTLYLHMKKVHRKAEQSSAAPANQEPILKPNDNIYLVSFERNASGAEDTAGVPVESPSGELDSTLTASADSALRADSAPSARDPSETRDDITLPEWHAARTHCTWPLPRHALTQHYVLDDDAHVEQVEGPGCDVYNDVTVRSDLFLHGNVPIDEDSQHMVGGAALTTSSAPDLCLIDAHPTIDLMQEALMYEDAVVDESSFRVFLMNGDELT